MNNNNVSHHSHHYFIGMKLHKDDAIKIKNIQQDIYVKNNFLNEDDKVKNMYVPFIYLGYFDEKIEEKLNEILMPLFFAIAEKFKPIPCYLKNFVLGGQSKNFKYVALEYETKDNCLEKIIIPYIKKFLDKKLGIHLTYEDVPIIPLFRLQNQTLKKFLENNNFITEKSKISFPNFHFPDLKYDKKEQKKYFVLENIEILSATPVKIKKGHKSFNEQLKIDIVKGVPLSGTKNC